MKHNKKNHATFEILSGSKARARIIDQRKLPHSVQFKDLRRFSDACRAIGDMEVRGAPLIGVTAAFGMYLASLEAPSKPAAFQVFLKQSAKQLKLTRPTAVNLAWAVDKQLEMLSGDQSVLAVRKKLLANAKRIADDDVRYCRKMGENGLRIIRAMARRHPKRPVRIMTHCNAGRLAAVEWGTATAPIYAAHRAGIKIHVWVSETRPRNQGASLTAWELSEAGVPHTLVVDNACGHLLQEGLVDLVIVGCDRMAANGDAANKIGTYLKALAAAANKVPFYVALPSSTIDWTLPKGVGKIPIEDRGESEVLRIAGRSQGSTVAEVHLSCRSTQAKNPGFDVTPANLISGIITERGLCKPSQLKKQFKGGKKASAYA